MRRARKKTKYTPPPVYVAASALLRGGALALTFYRGNKTLVVDRRAPSHNPERDAVLALARAREGLNCRLADLRVIAAGGVPPVPDLPASGRCLCGARGWLVDGKCRECTE